MRNLLAALILFFSLSGMAQTVPIKNLNPTTMTSMTRQEVVWIYTMRTRFWADGSKIVVFYQDFDTRAHNEFCREVLRINPTQFQTSIETYVNVGNAAYFRKVINEQEMYRMVERTPGAVGYLSESVLLINGGSGVRQISISGL
jgi:hypothetical protein